jgi:hypothetical protein
VNRAWQRPRAVIIGAGVLAAMAAAGLLFVGIGSFGLWTPSETQLASLALSAPSAAPLPALGVRLFGHGEAAARIPGALVALLGLGAVAWAGAGLHTLRAGLLAAAALAGFPLFVLQARQLTTDLPACLGMALALGGLGRAGRVAGWGPRGGARGQAMAAALTAFAVGLLIATWGAGVLGGALPLLGAAAVGFALAESPTAWRSRSWRLGAAVAGTGFVILAVALIAIRHTAGAPSWLLGGVPRGGPRAATFEAALETVGFGLFPLAGLALFAFFAPSQRGRGNLPGLLLLVTAALALFVATVQLHLVGHAGMGLLAPCALALGAWFDQRLRGDGDAQDDPQDDASAPGASGHDNPLLGFVAATAALLLARDLTLFPEALVSSHLSARIAWPAGLTITPWVLGVAVASALGTAALLWRPQPGQRSWRAGALALVLGPPIVLGFVIAHGVVPALSRHLSSRAQLDRFRQLAPAGATLALYRVGQEETGVFDPPPSQLLRDAGELIAQLGRAPDRFALVPRSELPALDAAAGEAGMPFAVADASSARHLLLAGRLPAGVPDENPLRPFVQHRQEPAPTEKPTTTWGNAIALLSAEFPPVVARGRGLPVTLTFRVLARPAAGQKIFIHLERPGQPLLNGDHAPLAGNFATDHWRPGDVIRDVHVIDLPRVTTPAGGYRVAVGFWPGGDTPKRLPITSGGNDGHDRAQLGSVQIQ